MVGCSYTLFSHLTRLNSDLVRNSPTVSEVLNLQRVQTTRSTGEIGCTVCVSMLQLYTCARVLLSETVQATVGRLFFAKLPNESAFRSALVW